MKKQAYVIRSNLYQFEFTPYAHLVHYLKLAVEVTLFMIDILKIISGDLDNASPQEWYLDLNACSATG
jgi:hypothetical protein